MRTTGDAQAVQIFPQGEPRMAELFWPRTEGDQLLFFIVGEPTCTAAAAQPIHIGTIRQPELLATWRGHRILNEAELEKIDFPYPPERDWDNR
jgi:hypothetical protein